jgi:hypothetical protein
VVAQISKRSTAILGLGAPGALLTDGSRGYQNRAFFAAVQESPFGTKEPSSECLPMSADWGAADSLEGEVVNGG